MDDGPILLAGRRYCRMRRAPTAASLRLSKSGWRLLGVATAVMCGGGWLVTVAHAQWALYLWVAVLLCGLLLAWRHAYDQEMRDRASRPQPPGPEWHEFHVRAKSPIGERYGMGFARITPGRIEFTSPEFDFDLWSDDIAQARGHRNLVLDLTPTMVVVKHRISLRPTAPNWPPDRTRHLLELLGQASQGGDSLFPPLTLPPPGVSFRGALLVGIGLAAAATCMMLLVPSASGPLPSIGVGVFSGFHLTLVLHFEEIEAWRGQRWLTRVTGRG